MELSMWIIKQWLAAYDPMETITEGKQSIEGVRLFTDGTIQNERYVYISRVQDAFNGNPSDEVLLMHGNDVISLKSRDLEEVFNDTLEAFEFYNHWEMRLQEAAMSNTPEQDLIDACDGMFGPMFLMDLNLNLIAFSKGFELGQVNEIWDDYIRYQNPSLKTIRRMKASNYSKLLPHKHDCLIYEEPNAAPYSYGVMVSYCEYSGKLLGQLAIASDAPIGECEIQLARCIESALTRLRFKTIFGNANSYAEGIFYTVISGEAIDEHTLKKLLILQDWEEGDHFCIVQAIAIDVETALLETYRNKLRDSLRGSIVVVYHGKLVAMIKTDDKAQISEILHGIAAETEMLFGVSKLFTGITKMPIYTAQALDALKYGGRIEQAVTDFHDCGLYSILHAVDSDFTMCSLHPLLFALRTFDRENETEYYGTLRVFLQYERSYLTASKALFVHRNTIQYRINKILELYPVDLNDPYEREYLLASYRFLD